MINRGKLAIVSAFIGILVITIVAVAASALGASASSSSAPTTPSNQQTVTTTPQPKTPTAPTDADIQSMIKDVYLTQLGRAATSDDLSGWMTQIKKLLASNNNNMGDAKTQMIQNLQETNEYKIRQKLAPLNEPAEQIVQDLYKSLIGQSPDSTTLSYWVTQFDNVLAKDGATVDSAKVDITNQLKQTDAYKQRVAADQLNATIEQTVRSTYKSLLGTDISDNDATQWITWMKNVLSKNGNDMNAATNSLSDQFKQLPEYKAMILNQSIAGIINDCYQKVLNRAPDSTGIQTWTTFLQKQLAQNNDPVAATNALIAQLKATPEYKKNVATPLVNKAYQEVFNRKADSSGLDSGIAYFSTKLNADASNSDAVYNQYVAVLKSSAEYKSNIATPLVQQAYKAVLGRSADASGLQSGIAYFNGNLNADSSNSDNVYKQYVAVLKSSDEYKTNVATTFVNQAYQQVLNRKPDQSGLDSGLAYFKPKFNADASNGNDIYNLYVAVLKSSDEYKTNVATPLVKKAYNAVLNRDPDQSGLASGLAFVKPKLSVDSSNSNDVYNQYVAVLKSSDEYKTLVATPLVAKAYNTVLNRNPDSSGAASGLAYIKQRLNADASNGTDVYNQYVAVLKTSDEYKTNVATQLVTKAYNSILNRDPDSSGKTTWFNFAKPLLNGDASNSNDVYNQLCNKLKNSDEYRGIMATMLVKKAYNDTLRRDPDASGKTTWFNWSKPKLNSDASNWTDVYNQLVAVLKNSAEYKNLK